jgi:hypothetical protein
MLTIIYTMDDKIDFEDSIRKYMEKLKQDGKPFCKSCFDDRNVLKIDNDYYCEDCLYMQRLLSEIKKI